MKRELPMMRVIAQRNDTDCSIAALAMTTGVTYEDALEAMTRVAPKAHRRGVWMPSIIAAADALGVRLVTRSFHLAQEPIHELYGILNVTITEKRKRIGHVVVVRWGLIFDPDDGVAWEPETYVATKKAAIGNILVREP